MPEETPQGQEPTASTDQASVTPQEPDAGQAPAEDFDPERAKALIEKLRPFEKEATRLAKELKRMKDAELSETERLGNELAELREAEKGWATEKQTILLSQAVTSEAAKAGALYPDLVIRSLDRSAVEFDDSGQPKNLDRVIGALKHSYPALFRSTNGSADGGAGGSVTTQPSMNDLIRKR